MHIDTTAATRTTGCDDLFGCVLVGIDDTPESLVAAAQAGTVLDPGGQLVLVGVAERHLAAHAGLAAGEADHLVLTGTSEDLARAGELVRADDTLLASGRLVDVLRAECERRGASLVVVGARPHGRLAARAFGGHDVEALRDSPCSLLVARAGWGPRRPDRVVVAVAGGPESDTAQDVGRALARRLGCELVSTIGLERTDDLRLGRLAREEALLHPGPLEDAVAATATTASLVVVGKAAETDAGLVERVAFGARGSVLVVRHEPSDQAGSR